MQQDSSNRYYCIARTRTLYFVVDIFTFSWAILEYKQAHTLIANKEIHRGYTKIMLPMIQCSNAPHEYLATINVFDTSDREDYLMKLFRQDLYISEQVYIRSYEDFIKDCGLFPQLTSIIVLNSPAFIYDRIVWSITGFLCSLFAGIRDDRLIFKREYIGHQETIDMRN